MVLGVQWLSTLGTIQWNFKTLHMEFYLNNKRDMLRGLKGPKVKIIEESQLPQAMAEACRLCMLQLVPSNDGVSKRIQDEWGCLSVTTDCTPVALSPILKKFEDLFQEPTGLPPKRGAFDHRIPLKGDAKPVNIRP